MIIGTDLTKAKPASFAMSEFGVVASCLDENSRQQLLDYAKNRYGI